MIYGCMLTVVVLCGLTTKKKKKMLYAVNSCSGAFLPVLSLNSIWSGRISEQWQFLASYLWSYCIDLNLFLQILHSTFVHNFWGKEHLQKNKRKNKKSYSKKHECLNTQIFFDHLPRQEQTPSDTGKRLWVWTYTVIRLVRLKKFPCFRFPSISKTIFLFNICIGISRILVEVVFSLLSELH